MSWFFEKFTVPSSLNGPICCVRFWGMWDIWAGGCPQSGFHTNPMWRQASRRIPKKGSKKNILLLGLGAGCSIPILHRKFPRAHITVVEYDPVMIELAYRITPHTRSPFVTIMEGNAYSVMSHLTQKFDIIILDIFDGKNVAQEAFQRDFFLRLKNLLAPAGFLLINAFQACDLLELARDYFSQYSRWRYRFFNHLGIFRHPGSGIVGDALPKEYIPYQQVGAFIQRVSNARKSASRVGHEGCWGLRWRCGPFWMERYTSDQEPVLQEGGPFRMMIWQRLSRTDIPQGWSPSWIPIHTKLAGFSIREPGEHYYKTWTSHAQRHRKKWRSQLTEGIWELVLEPSKEEFLAAYWKTKKDPTTKFVLADLIKEEFQVHGDRTHLVAVRRKGVEHAPLEAGFCFLDIPENGESIHITSFIHENLKKESVGVGLMDYWFETAPQRDIRFLNFGIFWAPGDPWTWKGFSTFKGQFDIHYLALPPALIRWTGSLTH